MKCCSTGFKIKHNNSKKLNHVLFFLNTAIQNCLCVLETTYCNLLKECIMHLLCAVLFLKCRIIGKTVQAPRVKRGTTDTKKQQNWTDDCQAVRQGLKILSKDLTKIKKENKKNNNLQLEIMISPSHFLWAGSDLVIPVIETSGLELDTERCLLNNTHAPLALGYFLSSCCRASSGNGHSSSTRISAVFWLAAETSLCFSRA